jgi:hypothetical protein
VESNERELIAFTSERDNERKLIALTRELESFTGRTERELSIY